MAFERVAVLNLVPVVSNGVFAVLLATAGWGYLSLILAWTGASVASIGAAMMFQGIGVYKLSLAHWQRIAAFGCYAGASHVAQVICQMLPQISLGRLIGFDAVGNYNRAVMLCQIPERTIISAFQPVILPAMAAELRAGHELKGIYVHGLALLTAVQWPMLLALAIFAEPVVRLLLGAQWIQVAPLLRIMALASLMMFSAPMSYSLLMSFGRVRDSLVINLITTVATGVLLVGLSPFGVDAVAASMFLTCPLQVYLMLRLIRRCIPLTWREIGAAVRPSIVVTLCSVISPVLCVVLAGSRMSFGTCSLGLAGASAGWIAGLALTDHPLAAEAIGLVRRTADTFSAHKLRRREI
jgi:O-antigen/teichoic acid export membrane protein